MKFEITETGETDGISKYIPITDTEVKVLATDYYKGRIFGSWDIPKNEFTLVSSVFMVLVFMDEITSRQILSDNPDGMHFFEYIHKSSNRNVNGYPIFMSCTIVSNNDVKRIIEKRDEIEYLLNTI